MRFERHAIVQLMLLSLAFGLGREAFASQESDGTSQASRSSNSKEGLRPEIERQRKEAEERARKALDKEAMAAIATTRRAVKAIAENNRDQALAAIEAAIGKINVLAARNPAVASIPVSYEVEVIDAAPLDVKAIRERGKAAKNAIAYKDYPGARALLAGPDQ